jgi:hypothetical protein
MAPLLNFSRGCLFLARRDQSRRCNSLVVIGGVQRTLGCTFGGRAIAGGPGIAGKILLVSWGALGPSYGTPHMQRANRTSASKTAREIARDKPSHLLVPAGRHLRDGQTHLMQSRALLPQNEVIPIEKALPSSIPRWVSGTIG